MRTTIAVAVLALMAGSAGVHAEPSGTFRQSHDLGFGTASSLDPISKGRVFQITEKVMNRLVRHGLDGKPTPDLAVDWSSNEDATEWVFKLREGVRFHDGTDFDAEDVLYSLGRVQDPELDSPARSTIKMVETIEAVDPMTVKMTLSAPYADLPLQLMDYRLRMIPSGSGDTIATTGVGTGPFRVESFTADGTSVLTANVDYWEGAPRIARIEIIAVPDAQARLQALLGGQIDVLRRITSQQKVMLESSDKYDVQEIPSGNWRAIVFRTDTPPFDDPRVRKALRMVADRGEMVDLVLGGSGTVSCDHPVAANDQYRADIDCPQDIEGAKALLAEAGHADGIEFDVHVSSLEPTWSLLVQVYQQQAEKAGITANIVQVPADGYWSDVWRKKPISMTRWGQRPADQILHEAYISGAPWNETYQASEAFDKLLGSARRELDFDARRGLYVQAQEWLWENGGALIPYHVTEIVGLTARVKDLDAAINDAVRWHLVSVD